MPLFFPVRSSHNRGISREEVIFELGLPSLDEIVKSKRRRLDGPGKQDSHFVCVLEDKATNTNDMDDMHSHGVINSSGNKLKGEGHQRW